MAPGRSKALAVPAGVPSVVQREERVEPETAKTKWPPKATGRPIPASSTLASTRVPAGVPSVAQSCRVWEPVSRVKKARLPAEPEVKNEPDAQSTVGGG